MRKESLFLSLFLIFFLITSCSGSKSDSPPLPLSNDYAAFSNPQLVTINGYTGDAMEPFISRDAAGTYLFFNNNAGTNKDLFYATIINGTTYNYGGPINVNTTAVDGTPSMNSANLFYYVSTFYYNGTANFDTLYSGIWNGSTVVGSAPLTGLTIPTVGMIYFDIEVSPDGGTLYLSKGDFTSGGGFPSRSAIVIATKSNGLFIPDPNSDTIMANVNTSNNLAYAPAISSDGLELFFTRYDPSTGAVRIYRAVRSNTTSAFSVPQLVSAITGFVEGPALSLDEKVLYYHRQNPVTGQFEIYRVTRP